MKRLLKQFAWSTSVMIVLECLVQIEPHSELVKTINFVFYELVREVVK